MTTAVWLTARDAVWIGGRRNPGLPAEAVAANPQGGPRSARMPRAAAGPRLRSWVSWSLRPTARQEPRSPCSRLLELASATGDSLAVVTVWQALQGDFGLTHPPSAILSELLSAEREHAEVDPAIRGAEGADRRR